MQNTIIIYTDTQGRVYYSQNEDSTLIQHEVIELPTILEEPLKDGYLIYIDDAFSFGYELSENKCYGAINDLKAKLKKTDYISHKEADNEDVSSYINYKTERISIRSEINRIEELLIIK